MSNSIFRLMHRARTRSQRRRLYAWTAAILFLFLLFYSQQNAVITDISPRQVVGSVNEDVIKDPLADNSKNREISFPRKFPKLPETANDDDNPTDLQPNLAPATLHFVWCGTKQYFEFRHYLAIKRADAVIKPDKIIFHYRTLPLVDHEQYYTWFNQTLHEIDHFVLRPLNVSSCSSSGPEKYTLILSLLEYFGGIYIPEDAILVDFPVHLRAAQFISGVVAKTLNEYQDGVIVAKKNGFISPSSHSGLNVVLASGRSTDQGSINPCGSVDHFSREEDGDCMCVKVDREIFPKNVWDSNNHFSALSRLAAYKVTYIKSRHNMFNPIPKIAHYICWDCELKFSTYLSMMSALHIAGLSKVYIHGIKEPSGVWWARLRETGRVIHVHREYPELTHDRATMTQELAQGIMRVTILLKYGGVYCDSKVIWTNQIPEEYFGYEAVASPDWHTYGSWPDSVSHMTIMAKKNAEYLLKLRNLHHTDHRHRFWFVDQFLSYKLIEQNPDILFLDRRLQVKCLNHNCHPSWRPEAKAPMNENPPGPSFNWQNDTLSVFWDVFPGLELDTVKYTSGPVVDAARRVLHMANLSIQELKDR